MSKQIIDLEKERAVNSEKLSILETKKVEVEERYKKDSSVLEEKFPESPLLVRAGTYVGPSTCNNFTSALGAAQRVLSYSYYRPGVVATTQ